MTKKHFIALAAEFNAQIASLRAISHNVSTPDRVELAINVVRDSIDGFCRVASDANPRFDANRFRLACGVPA